METSTRELIDSFLSQRRIAMVGVSRNKKDFSRTLFGELLNRGYGVIPVNPQSTDIEGIKCFARVQDISPEVDAALLLTAPEVTEQIVKDCNEAGITKIWMQAGVGMGAASQTAIDYCNENGINAITGNCVFMFLPDSGFIHKFHGFIKKLTGSYPKSEISIT